MIRPNRIREWRDKRGLSLEELGSMVGMDGSNVGKMERGTRETNISWLMKFADALACDAAELLPSGRRNDPVDRLAKDAEASTGFDWAKEAGIQITPWPVPVRGDGTDGFSPHGCAWFGAGFLAQFDLDPSRCEVIEVRSHSMQDTVPHGSACLVDRNRTYLRHGALYCLERDKEPVIRRAKERPTQEPRWIFVADDDAMEPIHLGGDFKMVGRVVWAARMLNIR